MLRARRRQAGWYRGSPVLLAGGRQVVLARARPGPPDHPSPWSLEDGLPAAPRARQLPAGRLDVDPRLAEPARPRAGRAGVLGGRRHVPRVDREPAAGGRQQRVGLLRRPAVRQRPAALRPPAHRLREGPLPALPDHARQAGAPPLRLGHPRPARRARGRAAARHHREERDRGDGHRGLQRRPRASRCCEYTRRVGGVRHPPGALGRLRARLQDARRHLHGVRDLGVQDACTTRASPTRATACCRTAGATRRRCRTTSCAWTTTSTRCAGPAGHGHVPAAGAKAEALGAHGGARARVDDHARGRCRRTSRSPSAPTSSTSVVAAAARRTSASCAGRRRVEVLGAYLPRPRGDYAKELGYEATTPRGRSRPSRGAELAGVTYDRALRLLRGRSRRRHQNALAGPRRRLRHDRGRHRHRAPGARLRRGRPGGRRGGRHPPVMPVDDGGRFPTEVPDVAGELVFDANKPLIGPQGGHGPARRVPERRVRLVRHDELRALLPALLALPQPADLQGGLELVRARDRVPRPHGRAQPADHLGARERQGRPVRQVARRRARLVDQPQPLLGLADPGVEERRPRRTRAIDVYGSLAELERDFGRCRATRRARPTCTARTSTS